MNRLVAAFLAVTVLLVAPSASVAAATQYPFCPIGQTPQFSFGFAALHQQLGATMGEPLECEHLNAENGDSLQGTSTGLAVYRAWSNTPTFTDGWEHWALTVHGLVHWTGSSPDPPLGREVDAPAELEAIAEQVMALRGLRSHGPVSLRSVDQDELLAYASQAASHDTVSPSQQAEGLLLVLLGLLEPDTDYGQLTSDMVQQVAGFYVPEAQQLYIVAKPGQLGPAERFTFVHEFTHALQDQHYDLRALLADGTENADRARAIHAVVEGDATLLQLLWAEQHASAEDLAEMFQAEPGSSTDELPLVYRDEVLFIYLNGLDFVYDAYWREGGYAGVDAVYRELPESSEQVLHPEKYRARERPIPVELPDPAVALGDGWQQLGSNVLGELDVRTLLEQYADHGTAFKGAAGWGGGRWQVLEQQGRHAVVLKIVWDTEHDAAEFFELYGQGLRKRFGSAEQVAATATRQALTSPSLAAEVRLNGREVLVVLSFDRPSAEAIVARLGWPLTAAALAPTGARES